MQILAMDVSYFSSMIKLGYALGTGGIAQMSSSWLDATEIGGWASWVGVFSISWARAVLVAMSGSCTLLGVALCILWRGRFMCSFAVAGLGFKYFNTNFSLMFGHPLRKPRLTALSKVEIQGLSNNW